MNDTTYLTVIICMALGLLAYIIASGLLTYRQAGSMVLLIILSPILLSTMLAINNSISSIVMVVANSSMSCIMFAMVYVLIILPLRVAMLLKWYLLIAIVVGVLFRSSVKKRRIA